MSFSEFGPKDYELIDRDWQALRESALGRCASDEEFEVVRKAYEFANDAHRNVRRRSGEPYMLHPIAVAQIVVDDIGLGYKSISAALLHDVVEDTDYTVQDIRDRFGDKIASLVDGLTKIKNVLDTERGTDLSQQSLQAENFKRILLTLNDDVRVVLIKMADRLHNCRTIEHMPEHKRDKILSETMFIFVPLAHRMGLYSIKSEFENIWLRYKEPDAYEEICGRIERNVKEKGPEMAEFVEPINEALRKAGFTFEIKKRVKTPYSVWQKMQTKGVSFEEIYDLYAIRIIFDPAPGDNERDQCYHIFSIITGIYRYMPERLRDWVKHPKSNGYEALHCTLLSQAGIWVEVQIRTRRMDDIAEKGIAAHWQYKKHGIVGEGNDLDVWLDRIKEILVNPDVNAMELLDMVHNDLTTSEIYVFTPKGEQRTLPKDATALDFAYAIHTEVGNRAIAAKVNQRLVTLSHTLSTGDKVEIITAEDGKPQPEWLGFLRTRRARTVVTDYFKTQRKQTVDYGRTLLESAVVSSGYGMDEKTLQRLEAAYGASSREDLLWGIGIGNISLDNLSDILKRSSSSRLSWIRKMFRQEGREEAAEKTEGLRFIPGSCCNPIPGDPVVGIKSPDGMVTVHKKSCAVADSIASKHGDWVVTIPEWGKEAEESSFLVRVSLRGLDRVGLLNEITRCVSLLMGVNMRRLDISAHEGVFEGYIDMYVNSRDTLDKLIRRLSSIDGLRQVSRSEL